MSTLTSARIDPNSRTSPDDVGGAERLERQLFIALLGGVLLLSAWISPFFGIEASVSGIPALIGALILAVPLAKGAFEELREGRASSDSLASLAVFAAIANEMYLANWCSPAPHGVRNAPSANLSSSRRMSLG